MHEGKVESGVVLQRPDLKTRLAISTKVNFGGLPDIAPHAEQSNTNRQVNSNIGPS